MIAFLRRPEGRTALFVLAVTLVRLIAARWIHLTEDEAYYRLWAQHLAFGYYDHPPMVAWWIRGGMALAGDNPLGVRLFPVLATALASLLAADLARALGGTPRTAMRAAIWYNATLTIGMGGILAVPDAAAALFWIACLCALARVAKGGSPLWWLAAGAAAGLAVESKYSAMFIAPGVVLWLATDRERRRLLLTPAPWAAAVLAVALFLPNLVWNAQHDWITIAKQFGRVAPRKFAPAHVLELLAAQFVLLNPLVAVYAIRGLRLPWRAASPDEARPSLALPILAGAPFAGYLVLHALHATVQAHWPVPLFSGLAVCAAMAVEVRPGGAIARRWRIIGTTAGLVLSAGLLVYMTQTHSRTLAKVDLILALRGWRELSEEVEALRQTQGAGWVGTVGYGTLSQFEAEHRIKAPTIQIIERDRYRFDQAPHPPLQGPGLVVDLARRMDPDDLKRCFATVTLVGELDRGVHGGRHAHYAAYRVEDPKVDLLTAGCPDTPERILNRFRSGS
ncbi:glycosyltransferase family 39 protein [Phenylobacterium aquaticum]|uniref:ArnT family glycosyltransferase n=1 Tax=Phenylobacterium aquaticum TaxID=1763816 RepID=UPI0026EAB65F|nr:glycosyltransferase family 39 protein [Phenylobacterium aquaticum]